MDGLGGILLSEINQTEKGKCNLIALGSENYNKLVMITKEADTDAENKREVTSGEREGRRANRGGGVGKRENCSV